MATRGWPGLGPVFAYEWLTASRRWQGYALRALLVTLLGIGLTAVWIGGRDDAGEMSLKQQADVGRGFYVVTTFLVLGLVGLVAPAATAGAICVDKARGSLTLLLTTHLTDSEIVLGKLAARLLPVLGLIACAAPVQSLATTLGGVDPAQVFGAILVCLACAIFGCSLALTLSVWGRKTHEVILATYALGILYLLLAPIWAAFFPTITGLARPGWVPGPMALLPYNPVFLVFAPLGSPPIGPIGLEAQARFLGIGLMASMLLVVASIWRIRHVVVHQAGRRGATRWAGWLPRILRGPFARLSRPSPWLSPSLDGNPVLWRERQRRRPSAWSAAIWGLYGLISGVASLWSIVEIVHGNVMAMELGAVINGVQVSAGLLLLSVSAATSLAEERQRGSLDVLLASPLSTREIVMAKWRGALRGVFPLTILPMLVAGAEVTRTGLAIGPFLIGGLIVAYGAAITSLGLALATWLPGLGRAIGLSAGLYVGVLIAAIPAGNLLGPGPDRLGFASAGPFMGVGYSTSVFGGNFGAPMVEAQSIWIVVWIVTYGLVALGLLVATLRTFNRCLGRVDDPTQDGRPLARRGLEG
ncbi:ABC transporter permease [Singulisphaera sp. PoT]|uniref:ABC transporter permease n=1 Tax=Singulisphaera sp. PoT TaxID=3411797 RepID=UPI003BF475EE